MGSAVANWLAGVDAFIQKTSQEEKERIWLEVKEMNLGGPTVFAYFNDLFENQRVDVLFEKTTPVCDTSGPPIRPYNLITKTPKYSLESFFVTLPHGEHQAGLLSTTRI